MLCVCVCVCLCVLRVFTLHQNSIRECWLCLYAVCAKSRSKDLAFLSFRENYNRPTQTQDIG